QLTDVFHFDLMGYLKNLFGGIRFGDILAELFNSITGLLGDAFLIIIYVVFIFAEETFFKQKLKAIFSAPGQFSKVDSLLNRIGGAITHYMGLKTLISLITGMASYFILLLIGIDSPAFWSFLIFLLNFIPNIGSLVATMFPAIFALLQFGSIWPFLLVLLLVGTVQVLVGNFLEPRIMGNQLNISPLVTILALSFWGLLWGITGMLLSLPITVIMVIIFSQFPSTRPIAIMLSKTGETTELILGDDKMN
ncbi:MAG TPA: AI-2E family transporter, partial [Phnomibacter sp.]|nr:AI-2E family transporter [Phnomibacter sp.]